MWNHTSSISTQRDNAFFGININDVGDPVWYVRIRLNVFVLSGFLFESSLMFWYKLFVDKNNLEFRTRTN